jgi:membrane protease YdiL (CAAX protease family)
MEWGSGILNNKIIIKFMDIDIFHMFLFVIPGFVTVWSFRFFRKNEKKCGDFEYFALSVFWGLVMLLLYNLVANSEQLEKLVGNIYAAALVLSFVGFIAGCLAAITMEEGGVRDIIIRLIKKIYRIKNNN